MQTERGTSGPRRTSKKYFPALSAGVTISHCVCDMQICEKAREREYRRRERPDDEGMLCVFCMILSLARSRRIFFLFYFFIKSLERLRRGQSYLNDTYAWTCLLQLKLTQPLHLVPPYVSLMELAYGVLCPFFFFFPFVHLYNPFSVLNGAPPMSLSGKNSCSVLFNQVLNVRASYSQKGCCILLSCT